MKKNPSVLPLYVGTILVIVASGVWLVPTITRNATDLANKQAEVSAYQTQINALNAAQQELDAAGPTGTIPINEATLNETIPPHRDYEDLLAMVESIGVTSGITEPIAVSYTPVTEGRAAAIAETPLSITARGSYSAIEQLLSNMQTSLRPIALKSVDLGMDEKGGVTASIAAVTYTRESTKPRTADTTTDGSDAAAPAPATTDLMSSDQNP